MKKLILESIQKLDFTIWWITLLFFLWSAFIMWWHINESFIWASGIIVLMFLVWFSIELILSALKWVKWLWKITGFITIWPEALVLIIWLLNADVLFAASTPLWSNLMNPILLLIALFVTWYFIKLKNFKYKTFFSIWFLLTASFAIWFFFIEATYYIYWIIFSLIISIYLFTRKIDNLSHEDEDWDDKVNKMYLPLWVVILLVSWYFLDPVVWFTAEASKAPKWLIGFLVLATLTSWPEFKSVISLLRKNKIVDSFENILVSNITNLWLAIVWVAIWFLTK